MIRQTAIINKMLEIDDSIRELVNRTDRINQKASILPGGESYTPLPILDGDYS